MSDYVIPPAPLAFVPVTGGGRFPVRRIFCVGQNYADHAREMGSNPDRDPPFFFTKPADTVLIDDADLPYPPATADLHHEIELVAAIGRGGVDIDPSQALDHVWGYAAGLDMTRRDLQAQAKSKGRPWDMSKGFDHSAPIGPLVAAAQSGHPTQGAITLKVNGAPRQQGDLSHMIWSLPETIAFLSRLVRLQAGDLIFTGTPAGVAAVAKGDVLDGEIAGVGRVRTRIA